MAVPYTGVVAPEYQSDAERELAIESLAREVGPMALGVATTMLGDRGEAQDALQDAYVQAYRALPGFRGDASMKTWFMHILVNSCQRHRRLWRRWTRIQGEQAKIEQPPAEQHADPPLQRRLQEAVTALPHRQRTAFVLRYIEQMSIREIAGIMDCAEGTAKASIHKAVIKLRVQFEDMRGEQ